MEDMGVTDSYRLSQESLEGPQFGPLDYISQFLPAHNPLLPEKHNMGLVLSETPQIHYLTIHCLIEKTLVIACSETFCFCHIFL